MHVEVVELYKNRLSDVSAQALSLLLEYSPRPSVHGFHLSHNYFTPLGVGLLLSSAVRSGFYPARTGEVGKDYLCPLWLRVEQQLVTWEVLSGLPEEEPKHAEACMSRGLKSINLCQAPEEQPPNRFLDEQKRRAELLLEEKSTNLTRRCQAEGKYEKVLPEEFRLLCMPECFEGEPDESDGWQVRRSPSCSKWRCVHIHERERGNHGWPMVHLPYFWSQKERQTLEPPEGSLLKLDPAWRNWRPRLPISRSEFLLFLCRQMRLLGVSSMGPSNQKKRQGMLTLEAVQEGADSAQDYQEVWFAYASYVRSCLEQRRGLQLNSFCKIGWTIQKKLGKTSYRPYFHFSDAFVRSYLSAEAARKNAAVPGELCNFEDFNFSKAALKFSRQLTKDQVFTMMRALVQRLGDNLAEGREVDLALGDVGKFQCRKSWFRNDPETADTGAAPLSRDRAPTTAPVRAEAAAPPGATGTCRGAATLLVEASQPDEVKGFEGGQQRSMEPVPGPGAAKDAAGGEEMSASQSAPSLGLTALQFKKELAFKEAMDRHIAAMEAHAAEAVAEKDAWDSHVSETWCAGMGAVVVMRTEPKSETSTFDSQVRQSLDDQVRTNNTLRNLAKQKDLALELSQLQANREELAMLRNADRAKKAFDRETLATAWNADIRMKNIWKAIETWREFGLVRSIGTKKNRGSWHIP
eukprot:g9842.t1